MKYEIKEIKTEQELRDVLEVCYRILGGDDSELYCYAAWERRLKDGLQPLIYAMKDGKILSCVLGRAENKDSLVIGFVVCEEEFRGQGITKALMGDFEKRARESGYKYITLGSRADGFYDSCGYKVISRINGQNIYQKLLD